MKKSIRTVIESVLALLAELVLLRWQPIILAVTGSAGKTTTKYTLGAVLKSAFGTDQVRVGYGNLSTGSGIPLAILNIPAEDSGVLAWLWLVPWALIKTTAALVWPVFPKYLVLEAAADRPGDIARIVNWLKPTISIVTNVGPAHLLYFKDLNGVAKEKGRLVSATRSDGLVILNGQDDLVRAMASLTRAKAVMIDTSAANFAAQASRCVADWFNISPTAVKAGLNSVKLPHGRFDIIHGKKDTIIIDSSYNANPVSMEAALQRLSLLSGSGGRKIAVLGDMLELGSESEKYHRQVGQLARQYCDYVVAIGALSRAMSADFQTDSLDQAIDHLLRVIAPGDTILVKASHGMHLENLVQALEEN